MKPERRRGVPLLPVFLVCLLVGGVLILAAIAVLPGPGPDPRISQVIVMHNSMIPARPRFSGQAATEASDAPHLESRIDGVLDGRMMTSWLYRVGGYSVSVHRMPGSPRLPENASSIPVGETQAHSFEITDLSLVCWPTSSDQTLAVIGAAPLGELLRFAEHIDLRGPGPETLPLPRAAENNKEGPG